MTVVEADHVDHAGAVDGVHHALGLGDSVGQRLLAEDVLARARRGNGDGLVEAVADADVDGVDLRVVERGLPVESDSDVDARPPDEPRARPRRRPSPGAAWPACRYMSRMRR